MTAIRSIRPLISILVILTLVPVSEGISAEGESTADQKSVEASVSHLVEIQGIVEVLTGETQTWNSAIAGRSLKIGDRIRTGEDSRAPIQLSDRSVIRLGELTILELQPPGGNSAKRFRLLRGSLFFLDRERPDYIEFDTPLANGAIRGTEFYLSVSAGDFTTHLALLDGEVEIVAGDSTISLATDEQIFISPGVPPQKTSLINAINLVQWALYYPAVLNPDDLNLTQTDLTTLGESLNAYDSGNPITALELFPGDLPLSSPATDTYLAALKLSAGNVTEAGDLLASISNTVRSASALRELITAVTFEELKNPHDPGTSSEWLARSYYLQSRIDLNGALEAARSAVEMDPEFGFAQIRLAELEFSFEHHQSALESLKKGQLLSPENAQGYSLEGFILLDQNKPAHAIESFDRAIEIDGNLGNAWLGRALAHFHLNENGAGRRDLQIAAAMEPQRSLFRSELGKAFSETDSDELAQKEFDLARRLDPGDPTPWLYSALHLHQQNRVNEAIRSLEQSASLNDNRAVFRSRQGLDRDLAVRSANLAAIYADADLNDVGFHSASRAVSYDYTDFSGHLFLAQSYRTLEDPYGFDLRYETPRESELLVANLLAPSGGGNLSQILSAQDHLRYFDTRPIGASSLTEYSSNGDWVEAATVFGTSGGTSYAVDAQYEDRDGFRDNEDLERLQVSLQLKEQITIDDSVYFQVAFLDAEGGDLARHYDPEQANSGLRFTERQEPNLFAGYHHRWSPNNHTLFLFGRLEDELTLFNPQPNVLFLRQNNGTITEISTPPLFDLNYASIFTLYTAEAQHIWKSDFHTIIAGGRFQTGEVESESELGRPLTGTVDVSSVNPNMSRKNLYVYDHWQILESLTLTAGLSYDQLTFPENSELPPLSDAEDSRDLLAPKIGLTFSPGQRTQVRAAYSQSLGGLFFDNSIRLEPTQIAGFTQAFRSLLPESSEGIVAGSRFETAGIGLDHTFNTGTYLGIQGELLFSDGNRVVGALSNSAGLPIPDTPTATRQSLNFREQSLSFYANQLIGKSWTASARYRLSRADNNTRFPDLSESVAGLEDSEKNEEATLHNVTLSLVYNGPRGYFGEWTSDWYYQETKGFNPERPSEDFWQHNIVLGFRFSNRRAEIQVGLLNITDEDYRLTPLNTYSRLPRERTYTASLRLNF